MEFAGEFETHITVHCDCLDQIDELQQWSLDRNLKFLHIVLARGLTVSQPMLTRRGRGTLTSELKIAVEICHSLTISGFSVSRTKIEAAPWNCDVPRSKSEALKHSGDRYFEHHIKLLLQSDIDRATLTQCAELHSAHFSRNILKIESNNLQKQFITQRCYFVGLRESQQQLKSLLDDINNLRHSVIDIESEFVVYDSNSEIDTGWINL